MEPKGGEKPLSLYCGEQSSPRASSYPWESSSSLCAPSLHLPNRDALGHPQAGRGTRTPGFESLWTLGSEQKTLSLPVQPSLAQPAPQGPVQAWEEPPLTLVGAWELGRPHPAWGLCIPPSLPGGGSKPVGACAPVPAHTDSCADSVQSLCSWKAVNEIPPSHRLTHSFSKLLSY